MINPTPTDTTDETLELLEAEDQQIDQETLKRIKRQSVTGATSYFLRTLFLNVIALVASLTLSAFLSPDDFGIFGLVTQIIGLLVFFSDVGLAASLIQKKVEPTVTDYRVAFTIQQLLSWCIVAVCLAIVATGWVADKTGSVGNWILLSLAISFPLASLKTVSSVMLERRLEFSKMVVPQIVEQLVFYGLLIFLVWRGAGLWAYVYAIFIRSIVGLALMWLIQPWSIGLAWSKDSLKTLLGFGVKFQLNDFLARVKDNLFYLVLGLFLPLNQFGYINWAKQWSMYPYNLTVQNVMAITFPTFSRLQGHQAALKQAIEKSLFFITAAIFPLLVGMCLFIWPLTVLVPKYAQWQPAIISFVLFTLSIGWAAISTPLTNTLNAIGKINTTLRLMIMWTSLTWLLTPILVWKLGYNGVALASLIIGFTSLVPIYFVKKYVPVSILPNMWRQMVAAIAMAVVGLAGFNLWDDSFFHLVAGMIVVGLVYAATFGLIGFHKIKTEFLSLRS